MPTSRTTFAGELSDDATDRDSLRQWLRNPRKRGTGFTAADFVEGERDPVLFGKPIKHLEMCYDDKFFVYLDEDYELWWHTTEALPDGFADVQATIEHLLVLDVQTLSDSVRFAFRRMLSNAMAIALCGKVEVAKKAAAEASAFGTARRSEQARAWALQVLGPIWLVLTTALVLVALRRDELQASPLDVNLVDAALCGAIGAVFWFVARIGKLELDPSAPRMLHYAESGVRVAIGAVAGWMAFILVASGITGTEIASSTGHAPVVIGFIAGVSERFLPDLVKKAEGSK